MLKFSVAVVSALLVFCRTASAGDRPNIVLIFSDDQGVNDVGCYGSEIPTPNIDAIAKQGIRFTNWYSASSICTPSRFGLLTGKNPVTSKDQLLSALMFLSEEDAQRGIRADETTIASVLSKNGYDTAIIGKWHLGHGQNRFLPVHHGFDLFRGHTGGCIDYFTMTYGITLDWYENEKHVPKNGYATDLITDEAVAYLESREKADKPFFLFLPFNAPHFGKGWNPSKNETVNIMQAKSAALKRVEFIEDKIRREFAAMAVSLDDGVGRIIRALSQYNLADDTLLIFLTDHGGDPVYGGSNKPLRGNKATLFDGGLKVPCVMRWPRMIEAGRTSDALLSSLDLFPTFQHLSEQQPEEQGEGISLRSHLFEGSPIPERKLFWQTGRHAELQRGTWTAFRTSNFKYVQDADGNEYLFDMSRDPGESRNLKDEKPELFRKIKDAATEMESQLRG